MQKILRVTTSLFEENSVSSLLMRELMEELIQGLSARGTQLKIQERDFRRQPVPHLDAEWLGALSTPAAERSAEQQAKVDYSDSLIAEVQTADTIIIALPMYNFTVPSMLKAWIDHIARAGVTFEYTDSGAQGLLKDKRVYFVAAMGGVHETGKTDFLRPYMKLIMSFIGLEEVEFISAEGLNMGPERRQQGLATAREQIEDLVQQHLAVPLTRTFTKTEEAA